MQEGGGSGAFRWVKGQNDFGFKQVIWIQNKCFYSTGSNKLGGEDMTHQHFSTNFLK